MVLPSGCHTTFEGAASARIRDAAQLVALARGERDEALRAELIERLVGLASAPAPNDGEAALALEGIDDQKHLATVAKTSPHDTVRTAALGRIHDVKLLSNVARQAADAQIALDAVARIADDGELLNIAVKTDHKDAGIAALERAAESAAAGADPREMLDSVANRAKNKAVSKRARAMMQAIEEAEAARRAALEAFQQRVAAIVARVEGIAAAPSVTGAAEDLAAAEREWADLTGTGTFEVDTDTVGRFGAAIDAARTAIAEHERREAERRAEDERRSAAIAARTALCEHAEALRAEDTPEQIDRLRAEWDSLSTESAVPEAEALRPRFDRALARAAERQANRAEIQKVHARLDELSQEADRLSMLEDGSEETWAAVTREWRDLHPRADAVEESVAARYSGAIARVEQRAADKRAAAEKTQRQQVQRIEQLIERAHKRAAAEDVTLREADRIARDIRTALEAPPVLEAKEQHALVEKLRAAQGAISPKLHELRELDEWKRFANAAVQEELIARTEAIRVKFGFDTPEGPKAEDLEAIGRELHEIQERWKTVAEAPRAQAQALWHRYRQAADPIQSKVREFFASRAEERKTNLQQKLALIERAEALADSTDWIKTADELKKLQAEWQQIGPVPRQDTKDTWKRFREACDKFFSRRNADLADRKETWSANLARKEALCTRAEELANSTEWEKAAAEVRRMQAEWKTIGPVRRNKSEAVWQRFRTACDAFFERYKHRDEIELQSKQADREALITELEGLAPAVAEGQSEPATSSLAGPELLERVRSLRSRWNMTSPAVRHGADPLSARFMSALERVVTANPDAFHGTEMDVEANRQKMEKLCARVEQFASEAAPSAPAKGSQALADMLREALAANTIGGRAGEESKWKAMAEEVRQAQSSFARLGPVPGDAGRALEERFKRATNRFFDQYRRKVPQQSGARTPRPVGTR
jgi:hypothetical protein